MIKIIYTFSEKLTWIDAIERRKKFICRIRHHMECYSSSHCVLCTDHNFFFHFLSRSLIILNIDLSVFRLISIVVCMSAHKVDACTLAKNIKEYFFISQKMDWTHNQIKLQLVSKWQNEARTNGNIAIPWLKQKESANSESKRCTSSMFLFAVVSLVV